MNKILYQNRCKCKKIFFSTKRPTKQRPANYAPVDEALSKSFKIFYNHELSSETKFLLNSFRKKYVYHAIDDILYALNLNSNERKNLLSLLHSPILSLHNSNFVDFFDIWIHDLYIKKNLKINRLLTTKFHNSYQITIVLRYKLKNPKRTPTSLW